MHKHFALAVTLSACAACGTQKSAEEAAPAWMSDTRPPPRLLSESELAAFRACSQDSDCVVALNGCCNCANGGDDVAINAGQLAAFKARFDCSRVPCTEMGSMVPCGSGSVRCADSLCVYTPPGGVK